MQLKKWNCNRGKTSVKVTSNLLRDWWSGRRTKMKNTDFLQKSLWVSPSKNLHFACPLADTMFIFSSLKNEAIFRRHTNETALNFLLILSAAGGKQIRKRHLYGPSSFRTHLNNSTFNDRETFTWVEDLSSKHRLYHHKSDFHIHCKS